MALEAVIRDAKSEPFFDAADRGELLIRQCSRCGTLSSPSLFRCPQCSSADLAWYPSRGEGTLIAWAAPHVKTAGGTEPASGIAIVGLDEGPWIHVHVEAHVLPLLEDADRVSVGFDPVDGGEWLPSLRVAGSVPEVI